MSEAWVHPTALVEEGVVLGQDTKVWDNAHIRHHARIGKSCIIGDKSYIAYEVQIGNYVKINTGVYVCAEVTIEDFCMLSAQVVFTNDRFPRAGNRDLTGLETSDVTGETLPTLVCKGTTIGANATIGPGLTLGAFSMIGMGAVVTRDVPPHALVVGNPGRQVGWVCQCGNPLERFSAGDKPDNERRCTCAVCGRTYTIDANRVVEVA